ncbi:MAG: hypothetical protein V1792_01460 [Pseudomonadota bacterium]
MNEADTCRKYVVPRLVSAGWDNAPHSFTEQRTFTDGRIIPIGNKIRRDKQKRADYLLWYTRDFPISIVEAKADCKSPSDGLQQAEETLEMKCSKESSVLPRHSRRMFGMVRCSLALRV